MLLKIDRKFYAPSGFIWKDLTDSPDPHEEAIRECRDLGWDAYCIYEMGMSPQAGFAHWKELGKRKVLAIAPFVLTQYKQHANMTVILPIFPDDPAEEIRYYGLSVRDNLIQDDIVSDQSGIRSWYEDRVKSNASAYRILPEGFDLSAKSERAKDLKTLLRGLEDDSELYSFFVPVTERQRRLIRIGVFLVVLMGFLWAGKVMLDQYRMDHARPVLRAISKKIEPHKTVYPVPDLYLQCRNLFREIPVSVFGWRLETVSCQPYKNRIRLVWHRTYGSILDLRKIENRGRWKISFDQAVETISFPFAGEEIFRRDLLSKDLEKQHLLGFFQKMDVPVELAENGFLVSVMSGGFGESNWKASFPIWPAGFKELRYPGIYGSSLRYDLSKNIWTLAGEILYAK